MKTNQKCLQQNTLDAISSISKVIEYHQAYKRHKDIIYRGVCHNLSEFISAMDAIDEALIFFEDNQPECPEINQLRLRFLTFLAYNMPHTPWLPH